MSKPADTKVTCIMPACGREAYTRRAVEYFLRQTYQDSSLLIVDDVDAPSEPQIRDLVDSTDRIRYVLAADSESQTCGHKMNRGNELADSPIRVAWNDDDWQADTRIELQVDQLERHSICWMHDIDFFRVDTGEFIRPKEKSWWYTPAMKVLGAALAYRRDAWDAGARYVPAALGDDNGFVAHAKRRGFETVRETGRGHFVYVRHDLHVYKNLSGESRIFEKLPVPEYLPSQDLEFYRALQPQMTLV